ncbi:MAG: hypothetical protein IJ934_02450 [Acetobacter sp.]|nr:hypothetical protein [Acetobacter sp.]
MGYTHFLPSIHIEDDRQRSDIITAYRPTHKTLQVIRAICGLKRSTATHIVGPYGSGKSLAALIGITLISPENITPEKASLLHTLHQRIDPIAPDLIADQLNKINPSQIVLLHGSYDNLAATLAECANVPLGSLKQVLAEILKQAHTHNIARIAIVWDEFGQHLETLARKDRSEGFFDLQTLAEWVVRQSNPRVTLTTLMHHGIHHYTQCISQVAQSSWKKIEGRFDTFTFFDDTVEMLEMIAETLNASDIKPSDAALARARSAGFFTHILDNTQLASILARTTPLTPAALQTLPCIASHVAQAERTLFQFLSTITTKHDTPVGVDTLYDYFAPAMRADRGTGGAYRCFIEAETALSYTKTDLERQIIKTIALLKLGRHAEQVQLPLARLIYALSENTHQKALNYPPPIHIITI